MLFILWSCVDIQTFCTVCCGLCGKNVAHSLFTGPVFGNMNQFTGLGVFVDTYPNAEKSHDVSDTLSCQCIF